MPSFAPPTTTASRMDQQLGRLIDELDRRDILDQTWLIITSDHGESFGEHPGVLGHGTSLYQTQLHVPLVIVPPARHARRFVSETVSLRDLAATVAEILNLNTGSPSPGQSLARFCDHRDLEAIGDRLPTDPVLSEVVHTDSLDSDPCAIALESAGVDLPGRGGLGLHPARRGHPERALRPA